MKICKWDISFCSFVGSLCCLENFWKLTTKPTVAKESSSWTLETIPYEVYYYQVITPTWHYVTDPTSPPFPILSRLPIGLLMNDEQIKIISNGFSYSTVFTLVLLIKTRTLLGRADRIGPKLQNINCRRDEFIIRDSHIIRNTQTWWSLAQSSTS